MYESLKNFSRQFLYTPAIENAGKLQRFSRTIVGGMGGSNHATEIIKAWDACIDITAHRDYDLPTLPGASLENSLIIASSYSGNTEEAISTFDLAREKNYPLAVVTTGGALLERAKQYEIPYILLPKDRGTEPRTALGYSARAIMELIDERDGMSESSELASSLDPMAYETKGKEIVECLSGKIPVLYSSHRNEIVAYVWKINYNETGKIPAYHNTLPELNHNELNSFDLTDTTKALAEKIHFLFLEDSQDHGRVQKRMEVTKKLYQDRGVPVESLSLGEGSRFYRIFSSIVLSYWVSYYTAKKYNRNPEGVPIIEEFKKLILE